jgi:hypothetical protein
MGSGTVTSEGPERPIEGQINHGEGGVDLLKVAGGVSMHFKDGGL